MWLITNFGFFSVVEKSGQKQAGTLTIRGRVKSDLTRLRDTYLPSMGPIEADKGTDYKYRAVATKAAVADAFRKAVAEIDYSNFKDSVKAKQGKERSNLYHGLWNTLWNLKDDCATP
jgi:hypothetical protein